MRALLLASIVAVLAMAACRSARPTTAQDLAREGTARMADIIREVVPDAERAARARTTLVGYQEAEHAYFESLSEHREKLLELNARYDAPRERFVALFDALDQERRAFKDTTVTAFVALREDLEPAEWEAVFDGLRSMDEKWEELAR